MTHNLILLRHGQSDWNQKNLFTGWVDVTLTEQGRSEAATAGTLLTSAALHPTVLHTSLLTRAITTANLCLEKAERPWIPVRRTWRLNERHYGALQGKNKAEIREEYGEDQFMQWRRSFDTPPPPLADDDTYSQVGEERYAHLGDALPRTECLADVARRLLPYWYDALVPDLRSGHTVLVVAHGNSLRALVKHLDGISDEDISRLNIPTGIPLHYELRSVSAHAELRPVTPGGTYLDPEAAADAIAHVASQGKK